MMKSLFLYTLLILNLFQVGFSQLDPEKESSIERLIRGSFIPQNSVTGMSISIVQNGNTIYSKGFMYQDIERGIPATNRTLFSIGSITKSFIGTLVMKTLSEKYPEAGESILDVPVAKLTNFNFTFSDRNRAESTSFRDLLSHRTCLRSMDTELLFGSMKYDSNKEYNYRTRYQKEECAFRSGYLYNNALFALTGELIADIAGKPIQQLVREFMAEIGMVDSTTIDVFGSYEGLPNMSQGYFIKDGQYYRHNPKLLRRIDIGLGAGGILSTSNDMAQYGLFHMNQGKVGDKQVISKEAMSWLYKVSSNPAPAFNGQGSYGYGLGLGLALWNGDQWINHSGYWPPYYSLLSIFPGLNISIFMVTNGPGQLNGPVSPVFVTLDILDIMRGVSKPNRMTPEKFQSVLPLPLLDLGDESSKLNLKDNQIAQNSVLDNEIGHKRTRIELNEVLGVYGEPTAGHLEIVLDAADNSSLQMNYGEWGIAKLNPTNNPVRFDLSFLTDVLQSYYTYPGTPVPTFHIDFSFQDTAIFTAEGQGIVVFKKDSTLDKLPAIPWASDSCGPTGGS